MASAFHLTFFDEVVCGGTGVWVDSWDDNNVRTPLPVDATDFIISAICEAGCTCTAKLYHSPDGVTWTQATDSNNEVIEFECTGGTCTCKVLTVSLLQYVKLEMGMHQIL